MSLFFVGVMVGYGIMYAIHIARVRETNRRLEMTLAVLRAHAPRPTIANRNRDGYERISGGVAFRVGRN